MIDEIFVVLDANILLHFQRPDNIDWCFLCGSGKVNLVIYPLLMSEVSKQKDENPKKYLRERARKTGEWLRQCQRNIDQPIRANVWFVRESREPRDLAVEVGLDWDYPDDRVIAHALKLQNAGKLVKVATNDGGLEMKLPDFAIDFLEVPGSYLLPPEADPERIRAETLAKENRELKNRQPDLQFIANEIALVRLPDLGDVEEYVTEALQRGQEQYEQSIRISRLANPSAAMPSLFSVEYSHHLQRMRQYLYAEHKWRSTVATVQGFQPQLKNTGSSPATFIRVIVRAPDGIAATSYRGTSSYPEFPTVRPEIFKYIKPPHYVQGPPEITQQFRTYNTPDWDMYKTPGALEFSTDRIGIGETIILPKLYITASKEHDLVDTYLNIEIVCDEFIRAMNSRMLIHVLM